MIRRHLLAIVIAFGLSLTAHGREVLDLGSGQIRELSATLQTERTFVRANEDVNISLTFVNTGTEATAMTNWFIPGDEFADPVFEVTRNGQPVDYMGPLVKRPPPTADDLVWLQPGEQITIPVELSGTYNLGDGGVYTIRYRAESLHLYGPGQLGIESLSSNPIELAIEGRPFSNVRALAGDGYKAAGGGGVSFSGRCSATQESTLLTAITDASGITGGAQTYLGGSPGATQRYTTWFGAYSSGGWNTAQTHFTALKLAFDTKPLVMDCGCKKSYYAYVYANQPYKIYVCRAFWSAPAMGTDSKAGTLVHEMSHFTVVAGTDDWAYGQSAAKSLALSDPSKALDNADSHEYFAENTPALP